jgi:hypothetical protein
MKPFRYTVRRSRKLEQAHFGMVATITPTETMRPIQGIMPASVEEWRVAKALDKLRIQYIYQANIQGGRVRGGQVVDFLLILPTAPVGQAPLQVDGRRWHTYPFGQEDEIKRNILKQIFQVPEVWVVYDDQLTSDEAALSAVRHEVYG